MDLSRSAIVLMLFGLFGGFAIESSQPLGVGDDLSGV
jgi:hypothetical protein